MPKKNSNPKSILCNAAALTAGVMILGLPMLNASCRRSDTSVTDEAAQEPPGRSATASEPAARPHAFQATQVAEPVIPNNAPVLADVYPALSSGALRLAHLTRLPDGVLLQAKGISITEHDMAKDISQMPPSMREQMQKNAFFILEQKATMELLLASARRQIDAPELDEDRLLQRYFENIMKPVSVTDAETEAFYNENRKLVGNAPLQQLKPSIRRHLQQEKQKQIVENHIGDLGRQTLIALSEEWIKEQAELALDNPVDKARASGKPSFVSFGADACMPCKMMAPFRDEIKSKYGEKLNVVYVNVNEDQFLSSRYGVRGIPHIIFFDVEGKEFHVHSGFMPMEQIEKQLRKIGVAL